MGMGSLLQKGILKRGWKVVEIMSQGAAVKLFQHICLFFNNLLLLMR
jgi:hypothetical protein